MELKAAELPANAAELAAMDAELDAMDAELAAKGEENERLTTRLDELLTCRRYDCDKNSVLGLRCAGEHGLRDEHAQEFCDAVTDHKMAARCVVPGCGESICKTAFLRCGVVEEVASKCVERLVRDQMEVKINAHRQLRKNVVGRRRLQRSRRKTSDDTTPAPVDMKRP